MLSLLEVGRVPLSPARVYAPVRDAFPDRGYMLHLFLPSQLAEPSTLNDRLPYFFGTCHSCDRQKVARQIESPKPRVFHGNFHCNMKRKLPCGANASNLPAFASSRKAPNSWGVKLT